MCGIAGIISKNKELQNTKEQLEVFRNVMRHRGPDEEGSWIEDWMGCTHVRLSIVDIKNGQQPMFNDDNKKIGIVFNGEIYNYKELRTDLIGHGIQFRTTSDTEVIIKMYEKYGTSSFERLNGMFSFCLWDYTTNTTYLVRDYIGMKPLYIYEDSNILAFASELKALTKLDKADLSLDLLGIQDYFMFRYTLAPHTIYKNIRKLPAGTYIEFKNMTATYHKYWDVTYNVKPVISVKHATDELLYRLEEIIKSQLMGEVPIGVLLSGGIDSSTIAYLINKAGANLTTFSIGYPEVNEFEYSRAVANQFGLKHVEVVTTIDDIINSFDDIVYYMDEPIADPACFPLYKLSEELKKYVTVVLSGEGGDELFSGYPQYWRTAGSGEASYNAYNVFLQQSYYYLNFSQFFNNTDYSINTHRYKKYFIENSIINGMMGFDLKTWVPEDLMMKADKMMMAHSLEGRFPFLDKRIIKLAHSLPENYKLYDDKVTKWILKKAVEKHLPNNIINRDKMGFTVPVDLLVDRMKPNILEVFHNVHNTELSGILNTKKLTEFVDNYYSRKDSPAMQVWTIFILLYWFTTIHS